MHKYRYCTPEWLEDSAKLYRETPDFEEQLVKVSWKLCFRVKAEPLWGIDEDIIFGVFFDQGKLTRVGFFTEDEAVKESDFLLAATPQGWKSILTKKSKFTADFMAGKVELEHGDKVKVVMIAPYANIIVDSLTPFEIQYPDEMTEEELENYRSYVVKFRTELGV